ncbi:hypothetical protein [Roseateles oligotrophus]|uniref:UbiA prenyltransferase family protein n=1 Tax=Roseateles oligotrophus TaxID=1769250 RepID=A0ABT2YIQ3_9BURK|nr:hypothetical protein [Roseateles oligotrophus]MCV2369878.1 hypothetical protein [Roseateles oligotrophus]
MREFLFGIVPGSVFVLRYHPNPTMPQLVGLFLMELAPFLIASSLSGGGLLAVLFGFLLVYSVYEIGYIHNDLVSLKEKEGRTDRDQFSSFRVPVFLSARIPVIAVMLMILHHHQGNRFVPTLLLLLFLICIFFLHNLMLRPGKRVSTFLALNTIKVLIRFSLLDASGGLMIFAILPHIAVKLLHYLKSKKLIAITDPDFRLVSLNIYLGLAPVLVALDLKLFLVSLPYFLNHNKALIYDCVRPFLQQLKK